MSAIPVIVCGVKGRMGTLIASFANDDERFIFAGGSARQADDDYLGQKCSTTLAPLLSALSSDEKKRAVVIDFSSPEVTLENAQTCAREKVALLVGTTALSDESLATLKAHANEIALMVAANTSLGANLLFKLSELCARALPDAEVEIVELHHRQKRDSPSGTALRMAEHVQGGRKSAMSVLTERPLKGSPRNANELGVFGVRGGTVPGEHTAYFFLDDERVELTHRVQDRAIFARGALFAARFLSEKKPGEYTMFDALHLAE